MNPLRALADWNARRRHRAEMRSLLGQGGVAPAAPVLSGAFITPETAMTLVAVYAAVNVISRDCAIMPRNVFRRIKGGGRLVAAEHPAHELVRWRADDDVNALRFVQTTMGHVLTRGNAVAEIERDPGDGSPQALHILHPVKSLPRRTKSGALFYPIDGDENNRLAPEDVLHFAGLGFDGIQGYSPIMLARQTMGLGLAAEQFGASFFGNSAIPHGMLRHPKRLSEVAAKHLRSDFYKVHQGPQNAHNLAVLEEGMDWVNTQISPEDAQFLATRKFQVVEVARLYSIPPSKLQDMGNAHQRNIEQSNLDYIATTLHGWIAMMEYEFNLKLLTTRERRRYSIAFDMTALMRGDSAARVAYYQTMRNLGAISADEIRDSEGLNPIGPARGGDLYIVQGQYLPLDQINKIPDSAAPGGPPVDSDPNDDSDGERSHRFNPNHDPHTGEFSDGSDSGAIVEAVVAKKTGKEEQRYGEAQEAALVKKLGGVQSGDNKAMDVVRKIGGTEHGIEVKTIVNQGGQFGGSKAQASMKADQVMRKLAWRNEKPGREIHTVVFDHRDRFQGGKFKGDYSGHHTYYKRGVGKLRLGGMHPIKSADELRKMMATPYGELPKAAQGKIQ